MSAESKQQKQAVIDEIKGKLDGAQSAVIVDYIGITVEQADELRKNLREANVDYTVYKNTLIKRAIDGTEFEPLKDDLEGPTALAISRMTLRLLRECSASLSKISRRWHSRRAS